MHFTPHPSAQHWATETSRATTASGVTLQVGQDTCCQGLHLAMGHAGITVFGTLTPAEAFTLAAQLVEQAAQAIHQHAGRTASAASAAAAPWSATQLPGAH